jgi:hypothetical protein
MTEESEGPEKSADLIPYAEKVHHEVLLPESSYDIWKKGFEKFIYYDVKYDHFIFNSQMSLTYISRDIEIKDNQVLERIYNRNPLFREIRLLDSEGTFLSKWVLDDDKKCMVDNQYILEYKYGDQDHPWTLVGTN